MKNRGGRGRGGGRGGEGGYGQTEDLGVEVAVGDEVNADVNTLRLHLIGRDDAACAIREPCGGGRRTGERAGEHCS